MNRDQNPRRRDRRLAVTALFVAVALAAAACGNQEPREPRRLGVTLSLGLPEGAGPREPLELRYQWTPSENFEPPVEDYLVFVHITDPAGNIIAQADHAPPLPTSEWRGDEPVSYSRWYFPEESNAEIDHVRFFVGLYDEGSLERVLIRFDDRWSDRPEVHRMRILPDDEQLGDSR